MSAKLDPFSSFHAVQPLTVDRDGILNAKECGIADENDRPSTWSAPLSITIALYDF